MYSKMPTEFFFGSSDCLLLLKGNGWETECALDPSPHLTKDVFVMLLGLYGLSGHFRLYRGRSFNSNHTVPVPASRR